MSAAVLQLVPPPARGGQALADEAFAVFWAMYPRKVARKAAVLAWRRLRPADRAAALQAVPKLREYWAARVAERADELRFCPHASTWLNQERWADEIEPAAGAGRAVRRDGRTPLDVNRLIAELESEHG